MSLKKIAALLALAALLAGCNTVKGFGQDLQKVGEKLEDSSSRKK
jgi:predicted small secreted protein